MNDSRVAMLNSAPAKPGLDELAHTGPGTLAGRYLRTAWLPVFHSIDVPAGRVKPLRIMSEDFAIYRGDTGTVHLIERSCPHRQSQFTSGYVEGDSIRCFYHAWKFDAKGQCIEQPAEEKPFGHRIKLKSYPVREYLGLVFAYLGEGEPPAFPLYPEFESFDGLLEIDSYMRDCNYFQNVENSLDHAHMLHVHRGETFGDIKGRAMRVEESAWGLTFTHTRDDGKLFISQVGMPNILNVAAYPNDPEIGWQESLFWWVPIDDESFLQFSLHRVPVSGPAADRILQRRLDRRAEIDLAHQDVADEILAGRMTIRDVDEKRVDLIRLQDDVAQVGQGRIVNRKLDHLGSSDIGVVALRKIWRREMQALEEGRPPKQWNRPAGLKAVVWQFEAAGIISDADAAKAKVSPRIVDVRPFVEIDIQLRRLGGEPR